MKKHTLLYNPIIQKFNRSSISEGSPIIENIENLQKAIDEYYSTGGIKLFADKENDRLKIIKDVIGFADGKNYQRAAAYIEDLYLNKQKNKIEFSFFFFIHKNPLEFKHNNYNISYYIIRCDSYDIT